MSGNLREYAIRDLKRRARFAAGDIDAWRAEIREAVSKNQGGLGLHRSQLHDIEVFWNAAAERRERVSSLLKSDLDAIRFFDRFLTLGKIVAGSGALLDFYKAIFAQRRDPRYKIALDEADLVAASCYQRCVDLGLEWGAIEGANIRTPPVTVLTGELSATAGTRQHKMRALPTASALHYFEETLLPIPFVFLPFDQARALWSLCSIHHEVGHVLAQDFALLREVPDKVDAVLLKAGATKARRRCWQTWLYEVIADTFGVLLAGVAYAHLLLQLLLRPASEVGKLDEDDTHPSHYVRIHLLCDLLCHLGVPALETSAEEVKALWKGLYLEPPWAEPFVEDCKLVAAVLLDAQLTKLKGHTLREFAGDLEVENAQIREFARALREHFNYPAPVDQTFDVYRLLPPAALLAAIGDVELDDIQARARLYLQSVTPYARPDWLDAAPIGVGHDDFVKGLAEKLDFAMLGG